MNAFETKMEKQLKANGWNVLRNGWPDFLCWKEDEKGNKQVAAVEVKSPTDTLRKELIINHALLMGAGFPVFVVRSEGECSLTPGRTLQILSEEIVEKFSRRLEQTEKRFAKFLDGYQEERRNRINSYDEKFAEYKAATEAIPGELKLVLEQFASVSSANAALSVVLKPAEIESRPLPRSLPAADTPAHLRPLLTVEDTAALCECSPLFIYKVLEDHPVPMFQLGKGKTSWRIEEKNLPTIMKIVEDLRAQTVSKKPTVHQADPAAEGALA